MNWISQHWVAVVVAIGLLVLVLRAMGKGIEHFAQDHAAAEADSAQGGDSRHRHRDHGCC